MGSNPTPRTIEGVLRCVAMVSHRYLAKKKLRALKNHSKLWRVVYRYVKRPRRKMVEVNVRKLNYLTKEGDIAVVPGVVLGGGEIDHKITVIAVSFTKGSLKKLEEARCRCVYIWELDEPPRGPNIKLIT